VSVPADASPPQSIEQRAGADKRASIRLPGASGIPDGTVIGYLDGPAAQVVPVTASISGTTISAEAAGLDPGRYTGASATGSGSTVAITLDVHRRAAAALVLLVIGGVIVGGLAWLANAGRTAIEAAAVRKSLLAGIDDARSDLARIADPMITSSLVAAVPPPAGAAAASALATTAAKARADADPNCGGDYDLKTKLSALKGFKAWTSGVSADALLDAGTAAAAHISAIRALAHLLDIGASLKYSAGVAPRTPPTRA
jgi:hypothetical protein